MNSKIYIHELIDIMGQGRDKYVQHMTANWCPIARDERDQLCYGVFATVGSTGAWPQVVNIWELDGWDGLVRNFEVEFAAGRTQDPSLAEWWSVAASLRRGGVDRILVPEPWTKSIEELTAAGVGGTLYAHEIVSLPPGSAVEFLSLLADRGRHDVEALGLQLIGAWRVAMVNDSECVLLWAIPDWPTWASFEQAWQTGESLGAWRATTLRLGADWRRSLLVDAPLSPLRTGRQPQVDDRRPLDEV